MNQVLSSTTNHIIFKRTKMLSNPNNSGTKTQINQIKNHKTIKKNTIEPRMYHKNEPYSFEEPKLFKKIKTFRNQK